jgi:hypothetical protein
MTAPDRIWWSVLGLAAGLSLGSLIVDPAHSAECLDDHHCLFNRKDPIVRDDAGRPHDVIRMTVAQAITEYDQALNFYGPEDGIRFKELLSAYLLGIETGLYVENAVRTREIGEPGFFCLKTLMTGSQLVEFMRERVRVNPGFAGGWYQISLARALTAAYPCGGPS